MSSALPSGPQRYWANLAPADFAALARADSDDDGSKAAGGDLGWVEKGAMPKPFEDALFVMQAGEVSEPPPPAFGWDRLPLRESKTGTHRWEKVTASITPVSVERMAILWLGRLSIDVLGSTVRFHPTLPRAVPGLTAEILRARSG